MDQQQLQQQQQQMQQQMQHHQQMQRNQQQQPQSSQHPQHLPPGNWDHPMPPMSMGWPMPMFPPPFHNMPPHMPSPIGPPHDPNFGQPMFMPDGSPMDNQEMQQQMYFRNLLARAAEKRSEDQDGFMGPYGPMMPFGPDGSFPEGVEQHFHMMALNNNYHPPNQNGASPHDTDSRDGQSMPPPSSSGVNAAASTAASHPGPASSVSSTTSLKISDPSAINIASSSASSSNAAGAGSSSVGVDAGAGSDRPEQSHKLQQTEQACKLVKVNVGGRIFQMHRNSLNRYTNSTLAKTHRDLENSKPVDVDDEGNMFFDRDPTLFESLLGYIRTKKVYLPRGIRLEAVVNEAKYFNIPGVSDAAHQAPRAGQQHQFKRRTVVEIQSRPGPKTAVFVVEDCDSLHIESIKGRGNLLVRRRLAVSHNAPEVKHVRDLFKEETLRAKSEEDFYRVAPGRAAAEMVEFYVEDSRKDNQTLELTIVQVMTFPSEAEL